MISKTTLLDHKHEICGVHTSCWNFAWKRKMKGSNGKDSLTSTTLGGSGVLHKLE